MIPAWSETTTGNVLIPALFSGGGRGVGADSSARAPAGESFIAPDGVVPTMTRTTYRCPCGARLEFKQDLRKERGTPTPEWKCKDCGTPVPGMTAEKIRHQHPS
ncbi:hypothetical protein A6E15_05485 [Natrinema saccharevitans]|uniref:Uncharacterized protein n=2 Tax=Natrinema TaxID=88723 RepID=A0A1S8AUH1_9EURY|nr:hypothetical protein A6E15_05485 [Natrinema saccharevitans]